MRQLPSVHLPEGREGLPPVGARFSSQDDLLPVYLLRFDRVATRRAYERDLIDFFGDHRVSLELAMQTTFVHVNLHVQSLQRELKKPSTIRRKVSAIRGFFDWLLALGMLERNPAHRQVVRKVDRYAHSERDVVVLTREEARDLLEATEHHGDAALRDHALILTLLHCALRRSEAAAMDVEHLRSVGPYWVLDLPHTKGGIDQTVKVSGRVIDALLSARDHYGITSGPLWQSLSNNSRGKRLSDRSVYAIVNRAARRAGLDIGAHTLRHTACTLAIEGGATPQQVQTHARHKKLETTMQYVHQRDKLRDNASDYIHL